MVDQIAARIAFIGAGNMANSLIQGLLKDGLDAGSLSVADPLTPALDKFRAAGIATYDDNAAAIAAADVVVLAVKPQVAAAVVEALPLTRDQLLISIAAGIDIPSLSAWSHADQPIVRCMPNTPALLGAGMTGLYP